MARREARCQQRDCRRCPLPPKACAGGQAAGLLGVLPMSAETPVTCLLRWGLEATDVRRATWGPGGGPCAPVKQGQNHRGDGPRRPAPPCRVATGFLQPVFPAEVSGAPCSSPASPERLRSPSSPKGRRCSRAGRRRRTRACAGSSTSRVPSRVASSCPAHSPRVPLAAVPRQAVREVRA